jgi:cytochrome c oxidase cbb3-type subunit 3
MSAPSAENAHVQLRGAKAQRKFFDFKSPRLLVSALKFLLIAAIAVGVPGCRKNGAAAKADPLAGSYDTEPDWNDTTKVIPLNYQQAQGKRLFYANCVWCHADATPAGPSNRSNVTPAPSLMNDGATLNSLSDEYMENMITLGGAAMGKSAMMPAWGRTLTQEEIRAVIAFARAIAQPPYQPPARPGPKYSVK